MFGRAEEVQISMFTNYYPEREAVRAFIFDDDDNLVLLKRIKTGKPVYFITAGGKIEDGESPEEALTRELKEEIDADAIIGRKLFALPGQTYYIAKVTKFGPEPFTHGPEFSDERYGKFELTQIPINRAITYTFNLQPVILKTFLKHYRRVIDKELADLKTFTETTAQPAPTPLEIKHEHKHHLPRRESAILPIPRHHHR